MRQFLVEKRRFWNSLVLKWHVFLDVQLQECIFIIDLLFCFRKRSMENLWSNNRKRIRNVYQYKCSRFTNCRATNLSKNGEKWRRRCWNYWSNCLMERKTVYGCICCREISTKNVVSVFRYFKILFKIYTFYGQFVHIFFDWQSRILWDHWALKVFSNMSNSSDRSVFGKWIFVCLILESYWSLCPFCFEIQEM